MKAWQSVKQFIKDFWGALGAILFLTLEILLEMPEFTFTWKFSLFLLFVLAQIINTQMKLSRFRNTRPNVVAEEKVALEKPFPLWIGGVETDTIVERYYLPFRNTKRKGVRIVDTDPIHAIVSFYDMDCQQKTSHEKPFWRGSPAATKRQSDYKVIMEASGKRENYA